MAVSAFAVTAPRDGGPLPESYRRVRDKDAGAFTHRRAWVQKARRLQAERIAFLARHRGEFPQATMPSSLAVTGTLRVPVLPGRFSDIAAAPVSQANLQNQLFASNPTGTITQYYTEVSYGQLTVTGDVLPWVSLAQTGAYYEGGSNGLVPGLARTGELIKEVLDARDGAVDFSLYDNDGPDGLPDSGDDDGFVDVAVFVHGEFGGECGNANIIAHSWMYSAWPASGGLPYTTGDARTGGGFIQIDEYAICPALNCGATSPYASSEWIDIGVFCHELGHSFGLPDLYDTSSDGNSGIGEWGIMGAGNWNTPELPAHPEAWTRAELGWIAPVDVGWQATAVSIPAVEQTPTVYRLPFTDERFRRSTACVISGAYSLHCGLTTAEAAARGWASPGTGGGYGPNWYQTIERDFSYSGTGSVSLQYAFAHDLEANYDFGYAIVEVNGGETVLATYTSIGSGTANLDLTPHLAPLAGAGGTYTLEFRVVSDYSFDDADGQHESDCGALMIDDVSVTGGGELYSSGFEARADGWHQDPAENTSSEYWLVENRRRIGFDANLKEQGLLIWHVDDEVMHAPLLGNSQGPGGFAVRGLVLEEADGQFDLNAGLLSNRGEAEDVYPGPLNNTAFTSATSPNSDDNTGRSTRIEVTNVGPSASPMSATLRAGDPGPTASGVDPISIDNNVVAAVVEVAGNRIRHGATFRFQLGGAVSAPGGVGDGEDIVATSLEWLDPTSLRGTVNVYSKTAGPWDLVVTNPDGQSFTLPDAITINHLVATQLVSASIDVVSDGVRLRYELLGREPGETLRLYRADREDGAWRVIVEDMQPARGESYEFVDAAVEAGASYYYLLESRLEGGEVRELHRGVAHVPARELVLEQNHPNPFNPATSIRLYLPARVEVQLDVYDVTGALVRRLASGTFDSGPHVVEWDGTDAAGRPVASGVYIYRLVADRRAISRKMMLLK
jgi:M6 family metalloprotease-like protein